MCRWCPRRTAGNRHRPTRQRIHGRSPRHMTLAASFDVGDAYRLVYTLTDAAGTPANATVTVTITKPDGTADTPTLTNPSTGTYIAVGSCSAAGTWLYKFAATGALTDDEDG